MSIANDIGPDLHLLADHSLDRETACIDDRVNVLDVDALTGEVADGPDAHVRCHGLIVLLPFCRPARSAEGHDGDGTDTSPLWFRGCAAVQVGLRPRNDKDCATAAASTEQTRICPGCRSIRDENSLPAGRLSPLI